MKSIKELRVGNFIRRIIPEHDTPYYAHDDCKRSEYVIRVECILPAGVNLTEANKIQYHYEDAFGYIEGIPLTPEWLERCGFVDESKVKSLYVLRIAENEELYWQERDQCLKHLICAKDFKHVRECHHIKHVHELQNFHRWFTGEELNVKL